MRYEVRTDAIELIYEEEPKFFGGKSETNKERSDEWFKRVHEAAIEMQRLADGTSDEGSA